MFNPATWSSLPWLPASWQKNTDWLQQTTHSKAKKNQFLVNDAICTWFNDFRNEALLLYYYDENYGKFSSPHYLFLLVNVHF